MIDRSLKKHFLFGFPYTMLGMLPLPPAFRCMRLPATAPYIDIDETVRDKKLRYQGGSFEAMTKDESCRNVDWN